MMDTVTAKASKRVSTMDEMELRKEIEGDFPQFLIIGRGSGGENLEEHQPEYVMEPINSY